MYNPFGKEIGSDLEESDLQLLVKNRVSEGFFVEYKEQFPSTAKTANGIAALANTYGGWFVVGMRTNSQGEADEVIGFDIKDREDPAGYVRNACRDHLDPYPVFRHTLVRMTNGRVVSVIWVPPSDETPHVAKDGRVYVRKGDAKEPVRVETKYQLEVVAERGKKASEEFSVFAQIDDLVIENNVPAIFLAISPRPTADFNGPIFWTTTDFDKLKEIVSKPLKIDLIDIFPGVKGDTHIPITSYHRSGGRIVLEQGARRGMFGNLTVEIDGRGRCRILVPVETASIDEILHKEGISEELKDFVRGCADDDIDPLFFDSPKAFNALMYLSRLYFSLIGEERAPGGFRYVMEGVNLHGLTPYADNKRWLSYVDRFGLSALKRRRIRVPFNANDSIVVDSDEGLIENIRHTLLSIIGLPVDLSLRMFFDYVFGESEPEDADDL